MPLTYSLVPEAFAPGAVDPETEQLIQLVEQMQASFPPINQREPAEVRVALEAGTPPFPPLVLLPSAVKREIPGPAGAIPLRIFPCEEPRAVYLHIHGGGWTVGGAHHQDPLLAPIAERCQVTVVSVEYRLAPEHPHPAGPDDCEAAALWLVRNAAREFGTDRLLIGGESAGGNLTAVTLLRMRDRHSFTGFAGANLVYGAYDLTFTPSVRRWGKRLLILSTPVIEWFSDQYVPRERRSDPDVSPLHADLSHLPPALFTIGTADPLLDDTLFMHARWLAAGNAAEIEIYPGGIHAFNAFPSKLATRALESQIEFLGRIARQ